MGIARKYSEVVCKVVSRYWLSGEMEATYYRVTPEAKATLAAAGLMEDLGLGDGPEVDWEKLKDMNFSDSQNSILQLEVEVEWLDRKEAQVVPLGEATWDF